MNKEDDVLVFTATIIIQQEYRECIGYLDDFELYEGPIFCLDR